MNAEYVLQTEHLKKHFGSVKAVEDVTLHVKRAEIFGFLGPNGAGKTTTISMLLGLTHATGGEIEILGQKVTPRHTGVLRRVGTMVGAPSLMLPFSARQNLQFMARLYPDLPPERIDEVLKLVDLTDTGRRKASKFSTGMKQRLGLALALLSNPELLILDEPTNGMDPAGMHEIRFLLRGLVEKGVTIFLSSHLLHEMELLCDRVAVIQRGNIIAEGEVKDLLSQQEVVRVHTATVEQTAQALRALPGAHDVAANASYVDVQGVSSEVVMYNLVKQEITPKEVAIVHADLESIFLDLTQKTAV